MRNFLLFATLLLLPILAFAQDTKKVAILETVDKYNKVPYGVKLLLRSNLTYAISNTPGYEGIDRVDMSSIMGEHNFQRTGMVTQAQIKKLGEMTGAGAVLVAEAAIYDASHIIITAKILNVETAGIENSAPSKVAGTDPESMEKACNELAAKLLGDNSFSAFELDTDEKVFDVVESMPEFKSCFIDIPVYDENRKQVGNRSELCPAGDKGLLKWIGAHLHYPAIAEENGIQGRVICTFIVERDGSITDVKVVRSVDAALDKEAIRVLKSMPKWIPGNQNGSPVRVKYTVPVTFRLQ